VKQCVDPKLKGEYPPKGVAKVSVSLSLSRYLHTLMCVQRLFIDSWIKFWCLDPRFDSDINTTYRWPCSLQLLQHCACSMKLSLGRIWALLLKHSNHFWRLLLLLQKVKANEMVHFGFCIFCTARFNYLQISSNTADISIFLFLFEIGCVGFNWLVSCHC